MGGVLHSGRAAWALVSAAAVLRWVLLPEALARMARRVEPAVGRPSTGDCGDWRWSGVGVALVSQ